MNSILSTNKIRYSKTYLQVFGLICLTIGFVLGVYVGLTRVIFPLIFATVQSQVAKDTDTDFNQGSFSSTEVSGSGTAAVVQLESGGGADWYNANWLYRKKITIDHTKVDTDLTNFPVLVSLSSDSDLASDVQDDGDDILFADSSGSKLDHEIEKFDDSTGELVAWVRIPSLSSTTDTEIYLYYGNVSATNQQNATGVWDSNFKMVQHLQETSDIHQDSTSNNNDGTQNGGVTQDATGKINGADDFDGGDDYIRVSRSVQDDFTIEFWFKTTDTGSGGSDYRWYKGDGLVDSEVPTTMNDFGVAHHSNGYVIAGVGNPDKQVISSSGHNDGNWHNVAFTRIKSTGVIKLYVDGTLVDSNTGGTQSLTSPNYTDFGRIQTGVNYFNGTIDEVKISNTARSTEWISTSYNNQNSPSDFYSLASEETVLPSSGTWVSPTDANVIDLIWNGGWGDGTDASTTFSATVANVGANASITFQMRVAQTVADLSSASYKTIGIANSGITFAKTKADLDALGLATGDYRYLQVKVTFSSSDGVTNPRLDSFTIYHLSDNISPEANASSIAIKREAGGDDVSVDSWINGSSPYFSWTQGSDSQSGLKGYCLYLGTDSSGNPATAKGLLGTSPVSTSGTTCQFIINSTSIDFATASYKGSTWISSSSNKYYLNIKAIDKGGNVYSGDSASISFYFDNTSPSNPAGLSAPQTYQSDINDITIYWATSGETAGSDSHSGVKGYQYKIGSSGTWHGSSHTGNEDCDDVITTGSYTLDSDYDSLSEGENTFYLRTWDNACNVTSTSITAILKYSGTSPTEPQNLTVTPSTNTSNSFAFSWEAPETYSGQEGELSYCYTINIVPSTATCTWTSNTSLSADAYATQPSTNTFYVVAKDEAGNVNYEVYASINFTADTSAPGVPRNVDIADISIKATSNWKLTISWDEPSDVGAGVSTYKIYHSTTATSCSISFSSFSLIGSTAGTSYSDAGLSQQTYYYCVKACDSANNCSAVSSTVSEYPTGKYTSPATLTSGPTAGSITTKKATITWSTGRNSDSKVQYGTSSGNYYDEEPSKSTQTTDHSITLTNLSPGTTCYYRAKWTDEDGNIGISEEKSFTTDLPPTLKEASSKSITLSSAVVQFTSKDATKAKIYYGKTTAFGGAKEISVATTETTYTVELTELDDGTKYYYKVNLFDSESEEYEGDIYSFETLPRPRISRVRLQQVKGAAQPTVLVTWESNTEISSIVTYYPTGKPEEARDEVNIELVKGEHKMLIRGLMPETPYILIVKGRDKIGNEAQSDSQKFTTALDTRPPIISNLTVEGVIQGVGSEAIAQLLVSWNTDEPATSQVEFGEGTGTVYSQRTQEDGKLTLNHLVIISNLTPSKVYHLRALSKDKAGNIGKSIDLVSITPKATESALELVIQNLGEVFGF